MMETHPGDASSEEEVTGHHARTKKRRIRKKKKLAQNLTSYSDSSDSDGYSEPPAKDDDKDDLKYSISQVPQSFSEIFAEAQSTLRETPDVLLSKYDPSQLPNIDWTSGVSKAQKSRRKSKKVRSTDRRSSEGPNQHDETVSTNGVRSPSKSKANGTLSHISPGISSSYLSIADMDTDTELNYEEENLPSTSRQASREPVEDVIVLSSDDEIASSAPNFSFVSRTSFEDSHDQGNESSDSIVVLSSRSPSPSPDIVVPTSLPPVRKVEDLFQMRIRVRYRNELYEFEGSQNWDTEQVREKLSEATNVPESELLLYTEDDQKMLDGKSLIHYGVACGDILEALRRSSESPIITDEVVSLKFQKEGLKKPLCLSVPKYSSLKEIRTKVAKILKMEEKKLFFRIDGETVDLCKTPEELELEDDICVDVFVKK